MRETSNCIVCHSSDRTVLEEQGFDDHYLELINPDYQKILRRLVVCDDCGFVYRDPRLDDADLECLYERFRDSAFRSESPDEYFDRITSLPREQSENSARIEWLRTHVPGLTGRGGRLLDVGCGGGVFAHTFLESFPAWTAAGVEPTPSFAELAQRRLNQPVLSGSYRSGLFGAGAFELITVNQVLEHVPDPVPFLAEIRKDLSEEGFVYLEVPDVLDLAFLAPDHDRFLMQHLWIFSRASLSNVCRQAGFEVEVIEQRTTIRQKRNLAALLSKSPRTGGELKLVRDTPAWVASLRNDRQNLPS